MTGKTIDTATLSPAVRWLMGQGKSVSDIGALAADILAEVFAGIYHVQNVAAVSFAGSYVEVPLYRTLSTYDWDHLTRLVVAAHDHCVRIEIEAKLVTTDYEGQPVEVPALVLVFHKRERMERGAEGYWVHAHPTLDEAVAHVRTARSIA